MNNTKVVAVNSQAVSPLSIALPALPVAPLAHSGVKAKSAGINADDDRRRRKSLINFPQSLLCAG
jgi:hypothetical protein